MGGAAGSVASWGGLPCGVGIQAPGWGCFLGEVVASFRFGEREKGRQERHREGQGHRRTHGRLPSEARP